MSIDARPFCEVCGFEHFASADDALSAIMAHINIDRAPSVLRRLDDFVAALRRDFAQAAHYRSMGDVLLCDGLTVSEVAEFLAETFDDIRRAKGFKDCDGIDWEAAWCFAQAQKRGGSRARRIVAEPTRDDEAPVIVDDLSADVSAVRIWGVQTTAASRSTQAA